RQNRLRKRVQRKVRLWNYKFINKKMDQSLAVLFALIAMILWGFEEFFLKEAIAGIKSITTYIINTLTGVVVDLAIVFYLFDFGISKISGFDLFLVVATTLFAFLGYFSFYKALEKQKLSLISSLDESWIVVSVLIALLFFGEKLGMVHVGAIVAVLVGAFLISAVRLSHFSHLKFIKGSGYELLAALFIGFTIPIEKVLVTNVGEANTLFYLTLFVIPVVFLAKALMKQKWIKPSWKMTRVSVLSGITDSSAFIFYLFAIKSADISVISPIVASSVVVTVILARIFLGEKMTTRQITGASIILAGVFVLSYTFGF
ncbi:MAG: DMT family transporter, partial [Patescibacteria group bacterium]